MAATPGSRGTEAGLQADSPCTTLACLQVAAASGRGVPRGRGVVSPPSASPRPITGRALARDTTPVARPSAGVEER
jgi:hypothetical protein